VSSSGTHTDQRSTPVPLAFERFYQPDVIRVFDKLVETLSY
jgi:2-oxoisovalerate dehydrogenase E1 component beta subunit